MSNEVCSRQQHQSENEGRAGIKSFIGRYLPIDQEALEIINVTAAEVGSKKIVNVAVKASDGGVFGVRMTEKDLRESAV